MESIRQQWPIWKRASLYLDKHKRRSFRLFKSFPDLGYKTIVDIGAYKGEFTDSSFAVLHPQRVVLVEADPSSYKRLQEKYKGNAACEIFNLAITDNCDPVTLRINSHRDSSSILPIAGVAETIFEKQMQEVEQVEVEGSTLDALFEKARLESVDLLKVDIQGAERKMIAGGKASLEKVKSIYIEVSFEEFYEDSAHFRELDALLEEHGFKLRSLHESRLGSDHCLAYANALYLRK